MSLSFVYPQYLWLLLLLPITLGLGLLARRSLGCSRLWSSLATRALLLIALVFALAGAQLRLRADFLTTVFILDVSDSISAEEQAIGEALIKDAIERNKDALGSTQMKAGDQAAVILFGADALVERLPFEDASLPDLSSVPVTTRTDIAGALQLAQAILPAEGSKRLVLLSDGRQNLGKAIEQAELAAANDIQLLYIPLGKPQGEIEVLIETLEAPTDVRQGENIELLAIIHSTDRVNAALRIFDSGNLIQTQELLLQPGVNRVSATVKAAPPDPSSSDTGASGFRRFRAQIIPDADTRLQNNEASAFTVVHGPPSVLLIEGQAGEGENLANALAAAEMHVERIASTHVPTTLAELAAYQAIILVNVNAAALPSGFMETLSTYVRDLGMGLVMIGGPDSYGAGGYLRTPLEDVLPVDMDVRNKELQANLALVLAVDKSGSMGRCHCDNPDLNQTYTRAESGQPKVDIAKEAVMRSASALGDQDYLGVVAFDNQARWVLDVKPLVDPLALEQAIGSFQAEGQTNLQAGVTAAYKALENVPAKRKHIILMTDGWVHEGELTTLAQEMNNQGITLSVIAAGSGSAEYLAALSEIGGGRYYPATDILNVPDIFLKETVSSVGQYIIEEPFYPLSAMPSPALRGLDADNLPPLLGYNGTTAKNTARLDLLTERGDPLLATWQYGLGRSAAWTSDMKGQWAKEWLSWQDFPRFAAQMVGWVLPAPQVEGLTAEAILENGQAIIQLEALDNTGRPLNFLDVMATIVGPGLETSEITLKQIGAGQYEASRLISSSGTYLIRLGVNDNDQSFGQITLGLVVPYSPEYITTGIDQGLLSELARITGGGEFVNIEQLWEHNLPSTTAAREIWQPLLLFAILLFPLDVAIRRVMFGPKDLHRSYAWLQERLLARRKVLAGQPHLLGQLLKARDRARHRQATLRGEDTTSEQPHSPQSSPASAPTRLPILSDQALTAHDHIGQHPSSEKSLPSEGGLDSEDPLVRLHEAKKRARRK